MMQVRSKFGYGAGVLILGVILAPTLAPRQPHQAASSAREGRAGSADVIARGRIEPLGRVVAVSGPPDIGSTVALVDKLLVDQGTEVSNGQILAVLNGFDLSHADYNVAMANLELAKLQRAQLLAGVGKAAEIAAQMNVLEGRRAQLLRSKKDWERITTLIRTNAASVQSLEAHQAAVDQIKSEVAQAENTLKALTEVRPVDDALSAGQVAVAEANLAKARVAMERRQIRARSSGTVLSIHSREGEVIPPDGILRMGDLTQLIVVAEVDEAQVGRVTLGMSARIEGLTLLAPLDATVTRIGREVYRQKRPSSDILVGRDAKIVEVEVVPKGSLPPVVGGEVMVQLITAVGGS